jgi:hypothetical protein
MLVGLIASLAVFAPLFGAMEIFVPCMLTGMLAGMAGAMHFSAGTAAAGLGAVIGVVVLALVYAADAALGGEQQPAVGSNRRHGG